MGNNYAIHVGVMLKEHLEAVGLTQKELCARIEVSTTIINEIIKGKRKMTLVGSIISFEEVSVYKNRPFMFTTLF